MTGLLQRTCERCLDARQFPSSGGLEDGLHVVVRKTVQGAVDVAVPQELAGAAGHGRAPSVT